ncbi:amylo-alpha-1,6-glucosidase [Mucilaginibacter ginsenosidivorans]|uniref:Glycogen debranching protein n=1 Tax=Mucilaginibacter ginsenosidivorans TaxID=398053 RepID=A0A5B8V0I8_9SPHI|nr:amylo-alpha-1,6-glucosidase [Mucilaginibacter ginsenosidivorans]QEC64056.1 glycogen debranching protein [Mucilaginibacter ginsenosidivorans]
MISIKEEQLKDISYQASAEWLETNGLGGYASSTIANCHSRRYHGLLVAATQVPTGRTVMVSKLDETIVANGKRTELGTNNYNGVFAPRGYQYLESFTKELYPQWTYHVDDVVITKSLLQLHRKNTTIIKYEVTEAGSQFQLLLQPFLIARDYHSLGHVNQSLHWDVDFKNGIFHNKPYGSDWNIYISVPGSSYRHQPEWYYNFRYEEEVNRGLDYNEDLLQYGEFEVSLEKGSKLFVVLSTEDPEVLDAEKAFNDEINRRIGLFGSGKRNATREQLILAADQFIVKRDIYLNGNDTPTEGATVIAGYHWFTDWGRDTMISLPGLCISTGRLDDAKKILQAFAHSVSKGMLPNFFSDNNGTPEFNNVDGTLWYFLAVYHYYNASKDKDFVLNELLPVLQDIIEWHYKGTRYNIHDDPTDHLLFEGEKGQQLTWMDARVGNWVVTPRMGKPVEIEALWYNALCIVSEFCALAGKKDAKRYSDEARLIKHSFEEKFWYEAGQYLYDTIDENNVPDQTFRPNQLFAISLPFPLIGGDKAKIILEKIKAKLYTPVGLRSLAPGSVNYNGFYGGDQWHRDSNYHQGAVWSWLLGPYVDALAKVKTPKTELKKIISDFSYHFKEGGFGTISEIFDGDAPHAPKGCIAQAWSVGELLRVINTYKLV